MPFELDHLTEPRYAVARQVPARRRRATPHDIAKFRIVEEVELTKLRVTGVSVVGRHVMDEAVDVDDHRKELAGEDPALDMLLAKIENRTLQQMSLVHAALVNPLGF